MTAFERSHMKRWIKTLYTQYIRHYDRDINISITTNKKTNKTIITITL